MAGAESRFDGTKECDEAVDTLSVVIFSQEVPQGWEGKRENGHL